MANHFSTVGFEVGSGDQLAELALGLAREAQSLERDDGGYLKWVSDSGVEMWLLTGANEEIVGMTPHFSGESHVRAGITERFARSDDNALSGAFYAWAAPPEDDPEFGEYPFVFDCPDFALLSDLAIPSVVDVQVSAFAYEARAFETIKAFDEWSDRDLNIASQCFFAPGLMEELDGPPEADAIFSGHVLKTERKTNEWSGRSYLWALVESHCGTYDAVMDPEVLDGEPKVGGVLFGSFWLSGHVLA